MNYEIKGGNMPVAICTLDQGETVVSESGAMGWMSENIVMDTNMKGGLFGGIGRALSGDSLFLNTFTCTNGQGTIAFPCSVPGKLLVKNLYQGQTLICQKGAFLAAETSVEFKIHLKKRISSGLFGGEGFILQRMTGPGIVFLEFDGHVEEMDLSPGETIKVDTGHVAAFESTVNFDIEMVKGVKNMLFGGEGLFLTTLTGPGRVYLQTMPISNLASRIYPYIPMKSGN
ncbi:TIGR00266 family protein [Clostridium senegalense]|uniref:TIGR00266 family protein n=1 Tax=Clostridium senegalense TaxID=1465809 RepID=UPI000289CDD5|nr:TIGR00266 family protein [Clostridium senegalense]MBU5228294.1 TIGR00266 family protein [Clostridium senegalense]